MPTTNLEMKEIWGHQFSIVENGLDEAEVSAFVGSLIDQKNDLASKLGHLHSLTKLAEKTVVEAEDQARNIKIGAEEKAKARATTIITRAEEKAKAKAERVITEAEEKARAKTERVITQAEEKARAKAERVITEAEEKARAKAERVIAKAEGKAKEEAGKIATEAKRQARAKAEKITTKAKEKAKEEAGRIIAEAERRAEVSAQEKLSLAERQAQSIPKDAMEKAEAEAQRVRQEAERLLMESRSIAESQIRDIVARFTKACVELLDDAACLVPEEGSNTHEPLPAPAASADIEADTVSVGPQEQPANNSEKEGENESSALRQGTVELAIIPPTSLYGILKLHRHLEGNPAVKFLYMKGTRTRGVRMRLELQRRTPLIEFLRALPEVESVLDRRGTFDRVKSALGIKRQEALKTIEIALSKMN